MKPSAEVVLEVPFHDVDMAGVLWHGHYYKYFEIARTELFRQLRCDYGHMLEMGLLLPVTETQCRYIAPLRYGMRARIKATLVEKEFRLKVDYLITEEETGKRLSKGHTIQVVVGKDDLRLMLPVPPELNALLPDL